MRNIFYSIVFFCLVFFSSQSNAIEIETYQLGYNLQPGTSYAMKTIQEVNYTLTMDQQPILETFKTTLDLVFDILTVDADGNTSSKVTIVNFLNEKDSTNSTLEDVQTQNLFNEMIKGKQFEVTFTRAGKIINSSSEEIKEKLCQNITNDGVKDALIDIIDDFFNDESIGCVYPSRAISEGKSWAITEKCDFLPEIQQKSTFTLAAVRPDKHILKVVTRTSTPKQGAVMNIGLLQMNVMLNGTGKGTIVIDKETGWVLSRKHTENIQGTATANFSDYIPLTLSFPCSMKSVTTIESHRL